MIPGIDWDRTCSVFSDWSWEGKVLVMCWGLKTVYRYLLYKRFASIVHLGSTIKCLCAFRLAHACLCYLLDLAHSLPRPPPTPGNPPHRSSRLPRLLFAFPHTLHHRPARLFCLLCILFNLLLHLLHYIAGLCALVRQRCF